MIKGENQSRIRWFSFVCNQTGNLVERISVLRDSELLSYPRS